MHLHTYIYVTRHKCMYVSELLADLFIRLLHRSAIVLASTTSRYMYFGGNYV